MSKPISVIIGDIHFTVPTLELATEALKQAIAKAKELNVPLIINGDTLDSKAVMRAECVNRLIELLDDKNLLAIINIGNHDMINEKGEAHSLGFLEPYAQLTAPEIKDMPWYCGNFGLVPYQSDSEQLGRILDFHRGEVPHMPILVHQGIEGANMGHYATDKSAGPKSIYRGLRVIGSHYHRRQDIETGDGGLFSYIGNPYSLTFGEAGDPEKGFAVLMDDGSLQFCPTNLPRHRILERESDDWDERLPILNPGDKVWVKLRGSKLNLDRVTKEALGKRYRLGDFKLDKIATDEVSLKSEALAKMSRDEILDALIEGTSHTDDQKASLKALWREVL